MAGSARGSGIRGKGGGAVVTVGRPPKYPRLGKPADERRPPRRSGSRCGTETTVIAPSGKVAQQE